MRAGVSFRNPISISLGLHALAVLSLLAAAWISPRSPQPRGQTVWIELDPPSPSKQKDERRKRIVQTQAGERVEKAPEQAFLGKQNQKVDRQTVSRQQRTESAAVRPASPAAQTQSSSQARKPPPRGKVQSFPLSKFGLVIIPKAKSGGESQDSQPEGPRWQKYVGAVAKDYVKGFQESDTTALNTKEYVFYGYFQRIRERLDIAWNHRLGTQLSKLWRKGRTLASEMDHTTRVLVTLDGGGQIVRVQMVEESGTRDLDEAAVKAFNDSGPFPNPPQGLADRDGNIRIRWDFVLKT